MAATKLSSATGAEMVDETGEGQTESGAGVVDELVLLSREKRVPQARLLPRSLNMLSEHEAVVGELSRAKIK